MDLSWSINSKKKIGLDILSSTFEKTYRSFQTIHGSIATSLNLSHHLISILSCENTGNVAIQICTFEGYRVTRFSLTQAQGDRDLIIYTDSKLIFMNEFIVISARPLLIILSDYGVKIDKPLNIGLDIMSCSLDGRIYLASNEKEEINIFSQESGRIKKFEPDIFNYGYIRDIEIRNDTMAVLSLRCHRFTASVFSLPSDRCLRSLQITFPFDDCNGFTNIRIDIHGNVFITFFNSRYFIIWQPDGNSGVFCLSYAGFLDSRDKIHLQISDEFQIFRSNENGKFSVSGSRSLGKAVYRVSEFKFVSKSFI